MMIKKIEYCYYIQIKFSILIVLRTVIKKYSDMILALDARVASSIIANYLRRSSFRSLKSLKRYSSWRVRSK